MPLNPPQEEPGPESGYDALLRETLKARERAGAELETIHKAIQSAKDLGLDKILADLPKYEPPNLDALYNIGPLTPSPDQQAVELLADVHAELEGLARLMVESGRQTAAMVETTRANLGALQTVVSELRESRKSADRSSGALFWLTVAIFAAGAVVALAAAPQIWNEIQQFVKVI